MNFRILISSLLVSIAILLVVLPSQISNSDLKPYELLQVITYDPLKIDVDLAARYLNNADTSIQFIDLRPRVEYKKSNIPGSINIPYTELLALKYQGYLNQAEKINILYSNGDLNSSLAVNLLIGKGYANNKMLKGGLNEWFSKIMDSQFEGATISARQNAIYENRRQASTLYTQINSLPDSLKSSFLEAKLIEEKQLDGGCE